jgi:Transposase
LALGGQAGTRLGAKLGISGSRDTILRLVRATVLPLTEAPKKVGVDDWAWKRGHRYGTLLCDLERGIPIDVLPDRSVETVTAWFQSHPGIELISRDRASEIRPCGKQRSAPSRASCRPLARSEKSSRGFGGSVGSPSYDPSEEENTRNDQTPGIRHHRKTAHQVVAASPYSASSSGERLAKYEQVLALLKQGVGEPTAAT